MDLFIELWQRAGSKMPMGTDRGTEVEDCDGSLGFHPYDARTT